MGRHHPDPAVAGVGDHKVPQAVHRHALRDVERGASAQAPVAREPGGAVAGHGVDVPGGHRLPVELASDGRHHPDPAVARVGHHQVAGGVHRHPEGKRELSLGGRPLVPGVSLGTVPGHGVDVPGGHRLPVERARDGRRHHYLGARGDDHVAKVIRRDARRIDVGASRRAARAERPGRIGPYRSGQVVGLRAHLPHRTAPGTVIRDVKGAAGVQQRARGHGYLRGSGRAADSPRHSRDNPGHRRMAAQVRCLGPAAASGQHRRHQRSHRGRCRCPL